MFSRLSLLWKKFTPLEVRLLQEVAGILHESVRRIYVQQVAHINKVQRHLDWTEICFYRMKNGRPDWSGVPEFPNKGEFKLAEAKYSIQDEAFTTVIWCISGHIFSLVTRPSIKPYAFGEIQQVRSIRLIGDPAKKNPSPHNQYNLPAAYYDHLLKKGAEEINGWVLLALEEIYAVSLPEGDYVVLASREGQEYLLAHYDAPGDQRIYYFKDSLKYPGAGLLDEIMRSV